MKTTPITFDLSMMMEDMLGQGYGISQNQIEKLSSAAAAAQQAVEDNRGTGWLGWMESPYSDENLIKDIEQTAAHIQNRFENFVLLGIGGSALGPIAVQQALNNPYYNQLPADKRKGPKFYVEDNVDPDRMIALLEMIDVSKTCFNVITKSGATAETMSQYLIVTSALKKAVGSKWNEHIIATTDHEKGNLIRLAKTEGFKTFFIPSTVGGRFSELTPVGLLPAAVCGIDIRALLAGAAMMDKRCKTADVWKNPALLQAVLQYISIEELGKNIQVVMPYADSLRYISDWFAQLWGESLGKSVTRDGKDVNYGQTPVKALGVTDQHSQLQLYTEGPFDKVITLIKVGAFNQTLPTPKYEDGVDLPDVAFLGEKSLNQLIEAECQGTAYALYLAKRMHQLIVLEEVNAHTIGQLLYFFQMTTAYMGELLNIDAFNQPGVEESKIASYAVLGSTKDAHQQKRNEMKDRPAANPKYTLA